MSTRTLPYQHLSFRVPWHDTGWEGAICNDPINNGSCLRLTRIATTRNDALEVEIASRPWSDLAASDLPPCAAERAGFMATHSRRVTKEHPYASWNEVYRKFQPTPFELPAYSADCVPFRWMLRKEAVAIADHLQLDYEVRLEEDVDAEAGLNNPDWVQHEHNQRELLDTFFSAIQPERSLCFVYAKEAPIADDSRRILIGVGRVRSMGSVMPYRQEGGGFGSVLWERIIQHSIRPTMEDGFLLPYHELLRLGGEGGIDPAECAVFVPEEFGEQFSYATEHVSHDAALSLLLALSSAVDRLAPHVSGSWDKARQWLSERIAEVWQARGSCPGLGAALTAFGITQGVLVAHTVQSRLKDSADDPWALVDAIMRDPTSDPENAARIGSTLSKAWTAIADDKRDLLRLLSRFDLRIEQATRFYQPTERERAGIVTTTSELLANPYRIYELDRVSLDPVTVSMIDRGVFPADQIRSAHPLPDLSRVVEPFDPRRVRALVIEQLERATTAGDSLRSQGRVIQGVRDEPLDPPCPLGEDIMAVCAEALPAEVETVTMADGSAAYQLRRLVEARAEIARTVRRRRKAAALPITADWAAVINEMLADAPATTDPDEAFARREKAAALEVLATSRISVLVGAAGTGKTTLLRALCNLPGVAESGFLLLAPTGKARVRMQTAIQRPALTLAQFLIPSDRYDGETGSYQRSDQDRRSGFGTVIVDECSMLTEEQLDALLDGIEGYSRLILVGDPRQLPPIGVGRPFLDITEHLRREAGITGEVRVGPSYAELTVHRRQIAGEGADVDRADLLLAEWFGGGEPSPGADEVWDALGRNEDLTTIVLREWSTPAELHALLRTELAAAIDAMDDEHDASGFQRSYGGTLSGAYVYFNLGAAQSAEEWQVLSPIRGEGGGVNELNRMLQHTYRESHLTLAAEGKPWLQKIPSPAGPQEIIYGDKVINVRNKPRRHYYPKLDSVLEYVANGEIGVVTGPFRAYKSKVPLNRLEVEFSTQPGVGYKFWRNELGGDDGASLLELAYAITIHKSQGSEFGITFVVIPEPCRLLSRELLYTALTRQRDRVVLLHQGDIANLKQYASVAMSETAARVTNLFVDPAPVEVEGRFLEAGLIHRTRKGIAVRSKSEVIIADLLYAKHIDFQYERPLVTADGTMRFPDFTIEDDETGKTVYWEHLGMLHRPSYRRKWEEKLAWYRAHGIEPHAERSGGGPQGTLITTQDGPDGSISSTEIERLVDDVLG